MQPVVPNPHRRASVGYGPRITVFAITALQILSVIGAAYMKAYDEAAGGFSSLQGLLLFPMILIAFPLLGVAGLIGFFVLRTKGSNRISSYILLLTSLFMFSVFLPSSLAVGLSELFHPAAERKLKSSREESRVRYEEGKRDTYRVLTERFQGPQEVVDAKSGHLLLGDGNAVKMYGVYFTAETLQEFDHFADRSLVGERVLLALPDYEDFSGSYSGGMSGVFASNRREFGDIPVLLYVDGDLLNVRYSRTGRRDFEKYLDGT